MRVAVTGGSGHIGGNLVRALVAAGHGVRVLVHRDTRAIGALPVERVGADLLDPASLDRALAGVEVVYHLAARISIGGDAPAEVRAVNVDGTRNVVDACLRHKVRRLVHFSSIHSVSPFPVDHVIDETRPQASGRGTPLYDRTKAEGERAVAQGVSRGLDAVTVIPTGVLGPNDFCPSRMGQILLDLCHRRLPALVAGGFDWVDVRDVVAGAMEAERRGRSGEKYLFSGHWVSVEDLAKVVEELTGVRAPRFVCPSWLARVAAPFVLAWSRLAGGRPLFTPAALHALAHHRHVSHDKATRELGYRPRPFEETVADTLEWFRRVGLIGGAA